MKSFLCIVSGVIILIVSGCKSTASDSKYAKLQQEYDELKAKYIELQKEASLKDAIIENLRKAPTIETPQPQFTFPPVEKIKKHPPKPSLGVVYNALKKKNFYRVSQSPKNSYIVVTIAKDIFQSGSDTFTKNGEAQMKKLVEVLKKYKPSKIEIKGYTDNTPVSYATALKFVDNFGLSTARAKMAKSYILKHLSISSDNVSIEGMGDTNPIASNKTKEGRNINRRIEFYLYY